MRRKTARYELPIPGHAWTRGAGHPAGIFHLEGRCHFAALSSPAEADLVSRGAFRFATVRFDAGPAAGADGAPLQPVRLAALPLPSTN